MCLIMASYDFFSSHFLLNIMIRTEEVATDFGKEKKIEEKFSICKKGFKYLRCNWEINFMTF